MAGQKLCSVATLISLARLKASSPKVLLALGVDGEAGFEVVAMEGCLLHTLIGEEYSSRGKAKLEMTRNGSGGVCTPSVISTVNFELNPGRCFTGLLYFCKAVFDMSRKG